jgi:hypothetical protein
MPCSWAMARPSGQSAGGQRAWLARREGRQVRLRVAGRPRAPGAAGRPTAPADRHPVPLGASKRMADCADGPWARPIAVCPAAGNFGRLRHPPSAPHRGKAAAPRRAVRPARSPPHAAPPGAPRGCRGSAPRSWWGARSRPPARARCRRTARRPAAGCRAARLRRRCARRGRAPVAHVAAVDEQVLVVGAAARRVGRPTRPARAAAARAATASAGWRR